MPLAEALALHQWAGLSPAPRAAAGFPRRAVAPSQKRTIRWPIAWRLVQLAQVVSAVQSHRGAGRGARPGKFAVGHWPVSERFGGEQALAERLARRAGRAAVLRPAGRGRQRGSRLGIGPLRRREPMLELASGPPCPQRRRPPWLGQSAAGSASAACRRPWPICRSRLCDWMLDARHLGQLGVERVEQLAALPRRAWRPVLARPSLAGSIKRWPPRPRSSLPAACRPSSRRPGSSNRPPSRRDEIE